MRTMHIQNVFGVVPQKAVKKDASVRWHRAGVVYDIPGECVNAKTGCLKKAAFSAMESGDLNAIEKCGIVVKVQIEGGALA